MIAYTIYIQTIRTQQHLDKLYSDELQKVKSFQIGKLSQMNEQRRTRQKTHQELVIELDNNSKWPLMNW